MHVTAQLDVEAVAVEHEDTVTVMLDLTAPQEQGSGERPAQGVIVVLDRSGSMGGGRLESAKHALARLVQRLDPRDSFGLVIFDHEAEVVIPTSPIGEQDPAALQARIGALHSRGSTDMSSGYLRGLQEAQRVTAPGGTTVVLLSDGHANSGVIDPEKFHHLGATAASKGTTTATIGIGDGYDDVILTRLAIGGRGNHTFAVGPDDAAAALAAELDGLLSKTVQAANVFIAPSHDVVGVALMNDLPSQATDGGVLVELGDFYSGEHRRLLLQLEVPAMGRLGLAQVADLRLEFVSMADLQAHTVHLPVSVNVVPDDVAKGRVPDATVEREKLLIEAQKAKRDIEDAMRSGDNEEAHKLLTDTRDLLQQANLAAPNVELEEEIGFLTASIDWLNAAPEATLRSVSSDRSKKDRGYKNRKQGGSLDGDGKFAG